MLSSTPTHTAVLALARAHYQAREFAKVVEVLQHVPRGALLEVPELAFMLADAGRRIWGSADVLDLAEDVIDAARSQGDAALLCDALNLQGVLLLEKGQPQAAERAWCELVVVASEADNPQYVARASNNLGVAAILDMRLADAIAAFQRACHAYVRLSYAKGLAQSNLNLGIVFRELDHEQESYAHFQRALTWSYAADAMDDVARVEQELALLQVYITHDLGAAAQNAELALQRFTTLGEPAGTADALRVIGVIALARHDATEADGALNGALRLARQSKRLLMEAEILLAQASVARLRAVPSEAYAFEQQALGIFQSINATPWGEQVQLRMRSLA